MSAEDDEFVARAGELWVWIDSLIDAAMRASIAGTLLLLVMGASFWPAMLMPSVFAWVVTQTAITRERNRQFPPEAS